MTNNYQMLEIGESTFYEKINLTKLKYIIYNQSDYADIIKKEESVMRRENKGYNAFMVFSKILNNCIILPDSENTEYGYIKVTYNKGSKPNPNNKGRWYSNKSIGLAPLCCCVRHTICDSIWVDIDQVNSHPTIFNQLMKNYNFKSKWLDRCLKDREQFLKLIMKELGVDRDDAKTKVIALINGGPTYKSSILTELKDEIKPCIETVINLPEYKSTLEYVKKTYDNNIEGKTISRILQMIENEILECYLNFFYDKGFINKLNDGYEVSLIFDGFQIRSDHNITDDILNECRKYALDKTGYDIELKIKPFDNPLILPTNYNIVLDEIPSIVDKYTTYITEFYDKNITSID